VNILSEFFVLEVIEYFDSEYEHIRKCYLLEDAKTVIIEMPSSKGIEYRISNISYLEKCSEQLKNKLEKSHAEQKIS
jgi:hypothetical protein